MQILIDGQPLRMYPVAKPGFTGGTEHYLRVLADGLTRFGHEINVVAPDLTEMEIRRVGGAPQFWWPTTYHPSNVECLILFHNLEFIRQYNSPRVILATNGVDPFLGPGNEWARAVDAYPVFSQVHADLLADHALPVDRRKCHVTGLGIDPGAYTKPAPVPGRLFYSNDPTRGLLATLDVFDRLREKVPHASLHVGYSFEKQFDVWRWQANITAEMLWECRDRLAKTPGVTQLAEGLSRDETVAEILASHVHVMPSDPTNRGTQIHGMLQMEHAAAGVPLVLSDVEAFPDVFGEAATILPVPGTFVASAERRVDAQDWADVVADLMLDEGKWTAASRKSRALAKRHTWDAVLANWAKMLATLAVSEGVPA